eukprot:COSAG05_NODE_13368_length_433_cov_0.706587_1_plen_135_part_10
MAVPLHMQECTGILGAVLQDPLTPPHVLVAISWNLACALKETPPFTDGFDATYKTSKCKLEIGARAPTPDDGGGGGGVYSGPLAEAPRGGMARKANFWRGWDVAGAGVRWVPVPHLLLLPAESRWDSRAGWADAR